jgi:hypothetical protein
MPDTARSGPRLGSRPQPWRTHGSGSRNHREVTLWGVASDGVRRRQIVDVNAITILRDGVILGQGLGRPDRTPEGEAHPMKRTEAFETSPVDEPVTVAPGHLIRRGRRSAAVFDQTFEGVLHHHTVRPLEVKAAVVGPAAIALLVWFWTAVDGRWRLRLRRRDRRSADRASGSRGSLRRGARG